MPTWAQAVDRLSGRISAFAGPGDRVAVVASNVPALVFALFAIWRVGAVAVPLSARLREFELTRVLGDAEPAAIVTIDSYQGFSLALLVEKLLPGLPAVRGCLVVDPLGEVLEEVTRDEHPGPAEPLDPDTAAILYTSGTTGAPKGALVSHACLLAGARELGALAELDPTDASILVVPIAHAFGLAVSARGGGVGRIGGARRLDLLAGGAPGGDQRARGHRAPRLSGTLRRPAGARSERAPDPAHRLRRGRRVPAAHPRSGSTPRD